MPDRERRAAERRLKAARFPTVKTLDDFDFAAQPSLNNALVAELMRCAFIDRRESVILLVNPGTGKSHLATALAAEAFRRGKKVRFWRVAGRVTQRLEAREERVLLLLKAPLARLDLLVLDELGHVPASKVGAELLFDVISTAYERTRVIVATNLPFEQWTEVLGSEWLVGATLDRLTHRCHILEATGESDQLRHASGGRDRGRGRMADVRKAKTPARSEEDEWVGLAGRPGPGNHHRALQISGSKRYTSGSAFTTGG